MCLDKRGNNERLDSGMNKKKLLLRYQKLIRIKRNIEIKGKGQ